MCRLGQHDCQNYMTWFSCYGDKVLIGCGKTGKLLGLWFEEDNASSASGVIDEGGFSGGSDVAAGEYTGRNA
jgi:hypothetical protein